MILPRRDLKPDEEARYREYILDLYADFTGRVAANRGMDIERVEALAKGRVYSGLGALNAGLIDGIGGIDDAVRIAKELANIPDDKKTAIMEYPKPRFFDRMLDYIFSSRTSALNTAAELFFPASQLEDLRYRIAHNGRVMPILPLD
jgi:protease-4